MRLEKLEECDKKNDVGMMGKLFRTVVRPAMVNAAEACPIYGKNNA